MGAGRPALPLAVPLGGLEVRSSFLLLSSLTPSTPFTAWSLARRMDGRVGVQDKRRYLLFASKHSSSSSLSCCSRIVGDVLVCDRNAARDTGDEGKGNRNPFDAMRSITHHRLVVLDRGQRHALALPHARSLCASSEIPIQPFQLPPSCAIALHGEPRLVPIVFAFAVSDDVISAIAEAARRRCARPRLQATPHGCCRLAPAPLLHLSHPTREQNSQQLQRGHQRRYRPTQE